ncbi:MAG: hypothetical protein V1743_03450, partial [Nanoarchaeota archaeon]
MDVMVKCKKCGKEAPSSKMVLDIDEKKVICPQCVKEKQEAKKPQQELKKRVLNRPFAEDFAAREESSSAAPSQATKTKYACQKCHYRFPV